MNIVFTLHLDTIFNPVLTRKQLVCVATPHPELYLLAFQSLLVHDLLMPHPYIKLGEPLVVRFFFAVFTSSTTLSELFDIHYSSDGIARLKTLFNLLTYIDEITSRLCTLYSYSLIKAVNLLVIRKFIVQIFNTILPIMMNYSLTLS